MFSLVRKNRRPTALRHVVRHFYGQREPLSLNPGSFPSHHIICAGTYSPVFARLAAESALAACPEDLRSGFRLYMHVDGVASSKRRELIAWLREVPGLEITQGLFGILSRDLIPGKWHQTMINDVVREFRNEKHLGFIDADLFLHGAQWFDICKYRLDESVFAFCASLRENREMILNESRYVAMTTSLFSVNTAAHLELNTQRFNKDVRAAELLKSEFPQAKINAPAMDTMVVASLRAQAHGLRLIDIDAEVGYCHVGGFSHLRASKFTEHEADRVRLDMWLARLRVMIKVLDLFDRRGWGARVEASYRSNINTAIHHVRQDSFLAQRFEEVDPNRDEVFFDKLFGAALL